MSFWQRLMGRTAPVTYCADNMLRINATVRMGGTTTPQRDVSALERPTAKRVNLAEWKLKRAAQKAEANARRLRGVL